MKERAKLLECFLSSPQTKAMLHKLPPGWFDKEAAQNALTIRLNDIENALAAGKIKTPLDIVLSAFPDYKLAFALNYLYSKLHDSLNALHNDMGYNPMSAVVNFLQDINIDIAKVQKWCEDLPFPELMEKLKSTQIKAPADEIKQSYSDLKSYIDSRSAYDLKDIPPGECRKILEEYNRKVLEKNGYIFLQQNRDDGLILCKTDNEIKKLKLKPFQKIVLDNGIEIPLQSYKRLLDKVAD